MSCFCTRRLVVTFLGVSSARYELLGSVGDRRLSCASGLMPAAFQDEFGYETAVKTEQCRHRMAYPLAHFGISMLTVDLLIHDLYCVYKKSRIIARVYGFYSVFVV